MQGLIFHAVFKVIIAYIFQRRADRPCNLVSGNVGPKLVIAAPALNNFGAGKKCDQVLASSGPHTKFTGIFTLAYHRNERVVQTYPHIGPPVFFAFASYIPEILSDFSFFVKYRRLKKFVAFPEYFF